MNNIDVVYTMWDNLKKTAAMDVGQVSFHRDKGKARARWAVTHNYDEHQLINFFCIQITFRCA